ncbi:palmitoyltransferase PFA4 [Ephemerocybe angulata]|uniref:Palmitoyltransferase n=1 Tax=Ephemerocybe angulata TaxID=980116 RepID=A0A8H6IJ97_9AGAR|nr:palmitoyltransferase PFA4 [Tulosesus angulatus]
MHYILGRIVVGLVVSLISFIAYSSQIFIIWPWYGREWTVELVTLLLPFNVLVAILFWNYYLCVSTDPGTVPSGWKPDTHADGYEVKKLTGAPRYCRMCQCYKPPRTHHCRDCDRCVLRMGTYEPLDRVHRSNTLLRSPLPMDKQLCGTLNYSHFLRFLFYVDVACSYHLVMVSKRVLSAMNGYNWDEPTTTELILIIMNYVTCVPVLLAVGGFSIYHFINLSSNSTTIEGWEKDKVATMVRKGQIRAIKFPYFLAKYGPRKSLKSPALTFADSPWTYENGTVNPSLVPSNASRLRTKRKPRNQDMDGVYNLPPYHPDFQEGGIQQSSSSDQESDDEEGGAFFESNRVRRGSEGEEMMRRYMEELNSVPDRYNRYEPEPYSESEESDNDDNVPLGTVRRLNGSVQV